ncbi:unnamed protein product [Leuciscus chuanchicus]
MAHILWRHQKMKVNLAAQVFSSSVPDALEFCNKELRLPQFHGSEETVEFLRTIDFAFDVLNSRNPLAKGTAGKAVDCRAYSPSAVSLPHQQMVQKRVLKTSNS